MFKYFIKIFLLKCLNLVKYIAGSKGSLKKIPKLKDLSRSDHCKLMRYLQGSFNVITLSARNLTKNSLQALARSL